MNKFESQIVQPLHYDIPLEHKTVPSTRPPKKQLNYTYSNATFGAKTYQLHTAYAYSRRHQLITTCLARGRKCIFVVQLSTELLTTLRARDVFH